MVTLDRATSPQKLMLSVSSAVLADFNGDGRPDNITFMIKRIKIHNLNALKDPTYRFPGNYGVEKFLELFSGECIWAAGLPSWLYILSAID